LAPDSASSVLPSRAQALFRYLRNSLVEGSSDALTAIREGLI
jgi:hypothetical protein